MRHASHRVVNEDNVAAFAAKFRHALVDWRLDAFEFGALILAAVLLLCPLFRLGAWLAEQHVQAKRRMARELRLDEDADEDDEDDAADPADDAEDHEAEAKLEGALEGANLQRERV
tara:strand:- start:1921 stop:2268 length:348 start_codon:yes stop_codon:yes gene_type:complete